MRALVLSLVLVTALAGGASAQAPSVSVACKDGSTNTGATARAACRGHGGVQAAAAVPPATPEAPSGAAPVTPGAPGVPPAAPARARSNGPAMAQAPGGGPGLVWVNTSSKAWHCQSDRYYGRTRHGSYMTEAAAKAQGAHGKTCAAAPAQ